MKSDLNNLSQMHIHDENLDSLVLSMRALIEYKLIIQPCKKYYVRIKSFISILQKSITAYVNLDFLIAQYTLIMLCSYVFSRISSPQSTLFLVSALCWRLMQQFLNTLDHCLYGRLPTGWLPPRS